VSTFLLASRLLLTGCQPDWPVAILCLLKFSSSSLVFAGFHKDDHLPLLVV
jgi:hypothetical protein